jgi:glucodextranase-like protein/PASTA domain-containing protein
VKLALLGAALLFAAPLAACGAAQDEPTACGLLRRDVVERQVRDAGGTSHRLRRERSESLDQSICRYSGTDTNVGLNVDSAPEARRRYFNRVTEALQFSVHEARQRPRPVQGLGDDDALGPAGAYWIPAYRQLFVLRGSRQFVYQFSVRRSGSSTARSAAVRIAAATLPGERKAGSQRAAAASGGRAELLLAAPRPGEVVRSRSVVVRGTVSGAAARVRVQGRDAPVLEGTFAREVPLRRGVNRLRVTATAGGGHINRNVTVRRGRSPAAVGAALARSGSHRMPDVLAQSLPDARALLRAAGIPFKVIRLADARLPDRQWAVCSTQPAAGVRFEPGRTVVLRADAADPFRTSGTACAQE